VGFSIYSKLIKENILYQFKIMLSIFFLLSLSREKNRKKYIYIYIYIYIREPSVEDKEELLFLLFFFSFLSSPIIGEICFIFVREKSVYIRTSGEENATEIRKN
jgi:hypothetical protein